MILTQVENSLLDQSKSFNSKQQLDDLTFSVFPADDVDIDEHPLQDENDLTDVARATSNLNVLNQEQQQRVSHKKSIQATLLTRFSDETKHDSLNNHKTKTTRPADKNLPPMQVTMFSVSLIGTFALKSKTVCLLPLLRTFDNWLACTIP